MKLLTVSMLLAVCVLGSRAQGAGRAFPVASENYVIDAFQRINNNIEWDKTNFLVDLSGQYANCKFIGTSDFVSVQKKTAEGATIAGYADDTYGDATDVNAVNGYIRTVIDKWTRSTSSDIYRQIRRASRFGCSVRPGCRGSVAVACLFSPASNQGDDPNDQVKQNALAFTVEQYDVAEMVTGQFWDRNHFLENLSGYETTCAMVYATEWYFPQATLKASERDMDIVGLYGVAKNRGETEPAMVAILEDMKKVDAKSVGCSIIPDCKSEGSTEMWVVVSCVFEV